MDLQSDQESSFACVCGRVFAQPGGLAYHQRSCKKAKLRLSGALRKAKDLWTVRKRHRFETTQGDNLHAEANVDRDIFLTANSLNADLEPSYSL
jgi:hypothetical protein